MTKDLFPAPRTWPDALLVSLYKAYPNQKGRAKALKTIAAALNRICDGEIDGKPRSQEEAAVFLREKVEGSRQAMYGRMRHFIPHPSTWFAQSRYLRPVLLQDELPARLSTCVALLSRYPLSPPLEAIESDVQAFLPTLMAIDKCLEALEKTKGRNNAEVYLRGRVLLYESYVAMWPPTEMQYIPNAKKFFEERRYEQSEKLWARAGKGGYVDERNQLQRVVGV